MSPPTAALPIPAQKPGVSIIDIDGLTSLIDVLRGLGYVVVGPTVAGGAIIYDEIASVDDLPRGWGDQQEGGFYRLRLRTDDAFFGYAAGPHSWKKFLFPPRTMLWQGRRSSEGFDIDAPDLKPPAYAFLGVRGCDLAAIAIQNRVFDSDGYREPHYSERRRRAFLVAVNCSSPAQTCFCASMGTGPEVGEGYDLVLTELIGDGRHQFLVKVGTSRGAEVLGSISQRPAGADDQNRAAEVSAVAASLITRKMATDGIKELLYDNYESPRWEEVASRCLACANCTMVCPTCFCSTVEDTTDLTGEIAQRWRTWDSCFTLAFSEIGGGSVRSSTRSRYRQWMTHKLATWFDQFGSSGCVGCGRCITWCPVGIDLTEEVRAMRNSVKEEDNGH